MPVSGSGCLELSTLYTVHSFALNVRKVLIASGPPGSKGSDSYLELAV